MTCVNIKYRESISLTYMEFISLTLSLYKLYYYVGSSCFFSMDGGISVMSECPGSADFLLHLAVCADIK